MSLLSVSDVTVEFKRRLGLQLHPTIIHAVSGVDLDVAPRETVAIAGESGSGKSTLARAIMGLVPATGSIRFEGEELLGRSERSRRSMRPHLQIVFQDPYSSLNPAMTIADLIGEPLAVHTPLRGRDRERRVGELLDKVELSRQYLRRYPDQLSGGQRQRVALARAIATSPSMVVLDEAVSALDMSTQNKIIALLEQLREELDVAYIFISHNLAVVEHIADRIAIMYLGKIVELGSAVEVFSAPAHPYTKALLSAVPVPDPTVRTDRVVLAGDIPSPAAPPPGCVFHTRCPIATQQCRDVVPEPVVVGTHQASCHYADLRTADHRGERYEP